MKFRNTTAPRAALLVTLCATAAAVGGASAEERSWSFSTGVDYSQGDYDTGQDTTIVSVPFSASYGVSRWRVGVTLPYVSVDGAPGVVPGSTSAIGGGSALSSVTNPLLGPTGPTGAGVLAPPIEEQGLGDATVELSLTPYIGDNGARFSVLGAARLPTGDEERSLGAGETVLSLAAGGAHPIGEAAAMYGAVGYSNATESGDDGLFASVGVEGRVRDAVFIGMSADWSQARIANVPERTQVTLYSAFDVNESARLGAYVLAGLSETAPDAGVGVRLTLH
ncbi:MAG: hypothetical protein AB7H66_15315 [Hyphomonadaceae bacterium]